MAIFWHHLHFIKWGCLYFQGQLYFQFFLCTIICKDGGLETWANTTCLLCNWGHFNGIKISIVNICKCLHVLHAIMCEWPIMWLKDTHLHSKCSKIRKKKKVLVKICTTWKWGRKIDLVKTYTTWEEVLQM
jgi:hypothetical protein